MGNKMTLEDELSQRIFTNSIAQIYFSEADGLLACLNIFLPFSHPNSH
jgi:hypothetical protein